jgi:flavin reductase (DIM6/NTAB) family NADH-FMN oxidoreductase RutF
VRDTARDLRDGVRSKRQRRNAPRPEEFMPIPPDLFRSTLGRFPTGVTVVTISLPDGGVHGITVSSFMSLSLEPPLVGVAIGERSRAHAMLPALARYGVSILAADQAPISDHFARRPVALPDDPFEILDGQPVIRAAVAQLVCLVVNQVPVGDHMLVVGRVEQVRLTADAPLAYLAGGYGRVRLD